MLLLSSMAWRFLQMFSFIFHFYRKRNRDWKGSRRGSGSLHHAGYSQSWDRTRVSWSLPFFSPFLCSFTVKSMFSDYFPLNASFNSLSREHFWSILILLPSHLAWLLCEICGLETFFLPLIISLLGFLGCVHLIIKSYSLEVFITFDTDNTNFPREMLLRVSFLNEDIDLLTFSEHTQ